MHKVSVARRAPRWLRALALGVVTVSVSAGNVACKVSNDDISRWERTEHGPEKLRAVLYYEKYELPLRVEAALALIRMPPRQGRRVGIDELTKTLVSVPADSRQLIVASLVPRVIEQLKEPPPPPPAKGQAGAKDLSISYKDAAYAMLTAEQPLIVDEGLKQSLRAALVDWSMADFERRLANQKQSYSMEQLMRLLGAPAVAGLPKLMTPEARSLDQMTTMVAELGDEKTKEVASEALTKIANYVVSDAWLASRTDELKKANEASKLQPTPEQFKAQLTTYQDEELVRVFGAMKRVGGRPAIDFALNFAAKKDQSDKRRQAALAATEGRLVAGDVQKIAAIAGSDAPDIVLDQAFRRLGELPRDQVVAKLYDLFKTDKWKVRRAAAGTVLKMSKTEHVDEFMGKLPDGKEKGFALPEALAYGAQIGDMKGNVKPFDALKKHMSSGTSVQKTTALSWYFHYGAPSDLPALEEYAKDKSGAPVCEADNDCKWICEVPKEGAKDPNERENKDVKTVGDYVSLCIVPQVKWRAAQPKTPEAPKPGEAPKTAPPKNAPNDAPKEEGKK